MLLRGPSPAAVGAVSLNLAIGQHASLVIQILTGLLQGPQHDEDEYEVQERLHGLGGHFPGNRGDEHAGTARRWTGMMRSKNYQTCWQIL